MDRLTVQLLIVAIRRRMPSWIEEGFSEYAEHMPPELRAELREIKPERHSGSHTAATIMQLEAVRIEATLSRDCRMIALDECGKDLTTVTLAGSFIG